MKITDTIYQSEEDAVKGLFAIKAGDAVSIEGHFGRSGLAAYADGEVAKVRKDGKFYVRVAGREHLSGGALYRQDDGKYRILVSTARLTGSSRTAANAMKVGGSMFAK